MGGTSKSHTGESGARRQQAAVTSRKDFWGMGLWGFPPPQKEKKKKKRTNYGLLVAALGCFPSGLTQEGGGYGRVAFEFLWEGALFPGKIVCCFVMWGEFG